MADRPTAQGQLARVLEILPRATRQGGVALSALADELGARADELIRDLQEVYTRAFYHPAGGAGDEVQVLLEADQVEVWTTGEFRRPPRLTPRESLALGLGLRVLAAESAPAARPGMLGLAGRLEAELAARAMSDEAERIGLRAADSPHEVRDALATAAREQRRCRLAYLKPAAPEPEDREVDVYALLAADGRLYAVGHCHRGGGVRVFRADRVAEVELGEARFEVPADFRADDYVAEGRVFLADDPVEVPVRYSARIARWIREQGPVEEAPGGAVLLRHRVSDPAWLVAHVLSHGADAEVLGPPEMRARVREAALRLGGG